MLNIEKLDFSYGQIEILKKIDIFVEEHSFIGIIGPNGSGKSTLLKNISRILEPKAGKIFLDSQLLNEYKAKELARKMAVVPQDTAINFDFTVYDLIMMGRNPYQDRWGRITEQDKSIVKEVMELTDTEKFAEKSINELSGGERQRVIIARALAQSPEILLLDEPTSSLDINYQGEIFDLLSHLNQELDLTIITVSHDLNLTGQYCNRLILLNEGEIFATGTAEQVLTEENIGRVYKTEVIVKENPLTDRPFITLIPRSYKRKPGKNCEGNIHLVCGGGTGKKIMKRLFDHGYRLSCGVINQGDADWEMARQLNIKTIEIPPFVPVTREKMEEGRECMENADYIIVSNTPFGHGNLPNLELVAEMEGTTIILEVKKDISERDYTGGQAAKYWQKIKGYNNCHQVQSHDQIIDIINQ